MPLFGDEVLGVPTACWYSAELDNAINRKFAPAFRAEAKYDPGFYGAATYVNGAVLQAAMEAVKGRIEDKAAFMAALRNVQVPADPRGNISLDALGNPGSITIEADGTDTDASVFGFQPGGPGEPTRMVEGRLPSSPTEAVACARQPHGSSRADDASRAVSVKGVG